VHTIFYCEKNYKFALHHAAEIFGKNEKGATTFAARRRNVSAEEESLKWIVMKLCTITCANFDDAEGVK